MSFDAKQQNSSKNQWQHRIEDVVLSHMSTVQLIDDAGGPNSLKLITSLTFILLLALVASLRRIEHSHMCLTELLTMPDAQRKQISHMVWTGGRRSQPTFSLIQ